MNLRLNPILSTDSYKMSHGRQYPPGTTGLFSYIEARSKKPGLDETLFFGLQPFLADFMSQRVTVGDVAEAVRFCEAHGVPFDHAGWLRIVYVHNGYLPVKIRAVPEGTVVPNGNVLATVESTDPGLPWVVSFVETALLRAIWYPSTVATRSYQAKKVIKEALERTADDLSGLPFKLHDFGARGVSSQESAVLGGMAHLVNFLGTDTMEALLGARHYYDEQMAGFSIPAAEHSTITSWGKDREVDAYRNMLTQFAKPGAVVAVVSDSYDIFKACRDLWGGELKQAVIDSGATLVIRPDSGDPTETLLQCLVSLSRSFGYTTNSKGFRLLNYVRLIQGDGLDGPHTIQGILKVLEMHGWSADNVAFGMGGGLLQNVTRDTLGFAMKCSAAQVMGDWIDVYKDPIGGGKTSKKGRLQLMRGADGFTTVSVSEAAGIRWCDDVVPMLDTVYDHGTGRPSVTRAAPSLEQVRAATGLW